MVNANKIKGRMAEMGISQEEAAEALGIKQPTFSQKCNGVRDFKTHEVQKLVALLNIDDKDVVQYFFAH